MKLIGILEDTIAIYENEEGLLQIIDKAGNPKTSSIFINKSVLNKVAELLKTNKRDCNHSIEDCMNCGYIIKECECKGVFKVMDYSWEPCPRCEGENGKKENENSSIRKTK